MDYRANTIKSFASAKWRRDYRYGGSSSNSGSVSLSAINSILYTFYRCDYSSGFSVDDFVLLLVFAWTLGLFFPLLLARKDHTYRDDKNNGSRVN